MNLFKVGVINRQILGGKIGGDSGKHTLGCGEFLQGLEGMVRERQDAVQDEQR